MPPNKRMQPTALQFTEHRIVRRLQVAAADAHVVRRQQRSFRRERERACYTWSLKPFVAVGLRPSMNESATAAASLHQGSGT